MYTPLSKIFYQKPNEYEVIYQARYSSDNSEHIDFSYTASKPFFTYTKEITNLISSILKYNTSIVLLIEHLPGAAITAFKRKCLVEEILQTNEIEGVHSTRKEITSVLDKPSVRKRFNGIVNKYLKLDQQSSIKTCQDIRNLYNEIVYDEIEKDNAKSLPDGKIFRKDSVSVYSPTNIELHKGLYPEEKIIDAITEALNVLNHSNIEPLISISIFHYLFGYIHPFYDGNGRTDRFISSYFLTQELNPLIGYRLSYTIKKNQKKYYEAFSITNDSKSKSDLTIFIIYFLEILNSSMENLNYALSVREKSLDHYNERIREIVKDKIKKKKEAENIFQLLFLLTQVELFSKDGITLKDISAHMSLTSQSVKLLLNHPVTSHFVIVNKKRKTYRYTIDLDLLS